MFSRIINWWENLCHGCGMCCYEKEFKDDLIYINMNRPCEYLDCKSGKCSVYRKRFEINSHCRKVNVYHAMFSPYLPSNCGYVRKLRFWLRRKDGR